MSLTEIFALIKEPYFLYDFAPFLSVAMAINFVSSFWDGVKNRAVNNLNESRDRFIIELNGVYTSGNCNQSDSVKDLNLEADKYKNSLGILSFLATSIGMLVVVGLFVLLALIGFAPKAELTLEQGLWLIFFSIIPSSFLRILGVIYSWYAVKKLKELSQIMKNAAKAAIKDNQQAAYATT
ncbi:hypothetical protein [Vibrio metschnikovii]|uniref:hypothetical protein n=1 Tax=Vibrio metschnikovii TaxID=28172 RepID=UPI001C30938E|nr:hypothetical protein [Vibrio metschnikovii]